MHPSVTPVHRNLATRPLGSIRWLWPRHRAWGQGRVGLSGCSRIFDDVVLEVEPLVDQPALASRWKPREASQRSYGCGRCGYEKKRCTLRIWRRKNERERNSRGRGRFGPGGISRSDSVDNPNIKWVGRVNPYCRIPGPSVDPGWNRHPLWSGCFLDLSKFPSLTRKLGETQVGLRVTPHNIQCPSTLERNTSKRTVTAPSDHDALTFSQ